MLWGLLGGVGLEEVVEVAGVQWAARDLADFARERAAALMAHAEAITTLEVLGALSEVAALVLLLEEHVEVGQLVHVERVGVEQGAHGVGYALIGQHASLEELLANRAHDLEDLVLFAAE